MENNHSIHITRLDGTHSLLSIPSLAIETKLLDSVSRFPESQWEHLITLALEAGLQMLEKIEPSRLDRLHQYREFEQFQRAMTASPHHAWDDQELHLLQQLFHQEIETLFGRWQQHLSQTFERTLKSRSNPDHPPDSKDPRS